MTSDAVRRPRCGRQGARHRHLRRHRAEQQRRLPVAVGPLGALAVRVNRDRASPDRVEPSCLRSGDRMVEDAVEDPEAAIGGVDDRDAGLRRGRAGHGHRRVMADHLPVVNGDGGEKRARLEALAHPARTVEVRMAVGEVVVLVQELGDRLRIVRVAVPDLDLVTGVARHRSPRAVPASRSRGTRARRDRSTTRPGRMRRFPSAPRLISRRSSASWAIARRSGGSPLACVRRGERPAPVVDVHLDTPADEVERQLDVAVRLSGVRVLEREAHEVDDRAGERVGLLGRDAEVVPVVAGKGAGQLERAFVAGDGEANSVGHATLGRMRRYAGVSSRSSSPS